MQVTYLPYRVTQKKVLPFDKASNNTILFLLFQYFKNLNIELDLNTSSTRIE